MLKRRSLTLISIVLFSSLYILISCFQQPIVNKHPILNDEFFSLSRENQLLTCKSCHEEVYNNFIKGPHYNAYTNYLEHKEYVNEAHFDQLPYQGFVNNTGNNCMSCHAPQNLFGGVFPLDEDSVPAFMESLKDKKYLASPLPRADTLSLMTGVDCISCHVGGNKIFGTLSAGKKGASQNCNPVPSSIVSSNISCLPCHFESVSTEVHGDFDKAISSNSCSSSCHQEYKDEKPTHYFNWSFDPKSSAKEEWMELLSGIKIERINKDSLAFVWKNTNYPHAMSLCVEIISFLDLYDNGKIVSTDTIRVNRKDQYDEVILSKCFGAGKAPGILGFHFPTYQESIVKKIDANTTSDSVKLRILFKQQYWLNDSLGAIIDELTFDLQ